MKTTEIKTARTVNGTVEYRHEHRALESDLSVRKAIAASFRLDSFRK